MTECPAKGMTVGGESVELCWRSTLEGGCDHDWQRRDDGEEKGHEGPDTRAAMVMHVTSMRPRREKSEWGRLGTLSPTISAWSANSHFGCFYLLYSSLSVL